ncbi:MAG: hypothetical protein HYU66_08435 [Armatimonadetes bacterium]|nr:hypothetical protein [Armatimonadota bacterium]
MRDDSMDAVSDAFEAVDRAVRSLAGEHGISSETSETLYRLAYRLTMDGFLTKHHLEAIDHFRRAHSLLMALDRPAAAEVVANFIALARDILSSLKPNVPTPRRPVPSG